MSFLFYFLDSLSVSGNFYYRLIGRLMCNSTSESWGKQAHRPTHCPRIHGLQCKLVSGWELMKRGLAHRPTHYPRIHGLQCKLCVWLRANESSVCPSVRPSVRSWNVCTCLHGWAVPLLFGRRLLLNSGPLYLGKGFAFYNILYYLLYWYNESVWRNFKM